MAEAAGAQAPTVHTPRPAAVAPAPVLADPVPGTLVGEYRVEGKLGEGGMGTVFAAVHPVIGKKAAIKVISPALCANAEAVERFVQEARAVNQIGHPNIVDIFSLGTLPDGRCYLAMEWLQGETLADRLRRGALAPADALDLLEQVCRALEAAHEKGVVHRDLKPDNVFLVAVRDDRPLVKLLDFGIAKLAGPDDARLQKTRTGLVMGTPLYLSPEQARGRAVDARTDVYSFGVVAYEMLVGRVPFVADNALDILWMHANEPPPRPSSIRPGCPAVLEELLLRLLDKDPAMRPTLAQVRAVFAEARTVPLSETVAMGGDPPAAATAVATTPLPVPRTPTPRPVTPRPLETVTPNGRFEVRRAAALEQAGGEKRARPSPVPAPPRRWKLPIVACGFALAVGVAFLVTSSVMKGGRPPASRGGSARAAAPSNNAVPSSPTQPPPPIVEPLPAQGSTAAPPAPQAARPPAGTIVVRAGQPDARVEVDGHAALLASGVARVPVDQAGEHVVVVRAPGSPAFRKTVRVKDGAVVEVTAPAPRVPGAAPDVNGSTKQQPPKLPASPPRPSPAPKETTPRPVDVDGTVNPFRRKK